MKLLHSLLFGFALAGSIAACGSKPEETLVPIEISRETSCALDGMLLADYPGPKAQMHFEGGQTEFFCDTVEMFSVYLKPEQARSVKALYVQDMGKADWDAPKGHWIDAFKAFYVRGSSLHGSMGPTIASFASEADAKAFSGKYGGTVMGFKDFNADMVVLDGGVLHDQKM